MDNQPIGMFDSGLGGLTVVKEIKKVLPNEDIVYLGDIARLPYGTRSKETIVKFSLEDTAFLISKKVKSIVIACNTASAIAYPTLKKKFKLPILEVVKPTVMEAIQKTKNKRIGVLGTRATVVSGAYSRMIKKLNPKLNVFEQEASLLVPLVEEGEIKGNLVEEMVRRYLQPLLNKKIDTLILGCTHYPLLLPKVHNPV